MNKRQEQILREAQDLIDRAWEAINKAMAEKARAYEEEQIADAKTLPF